MQLTCKSRCSAFEQNTQLCFLTLDSLFGSTYSDGVLLEPDVPSYHRHWTKYFWRRHTCTLDSIFAGLFTHMLGLGPDFGMVMMGTSG
jgi:hypothetical protein